MICSVVECVLLSELLALLSLCFGPRVGVLLILTPKLYFWPPVRVVTGIHVNLPLRNLLKCQWLQPYAFFFPVNSVHVKGLPPLTLVLFFF